MLQTVILEDHPSHREELLTQLSAWPLADRLEVQCAASAEELESLLRHTPIDILLADIDLGDGNPTSIQLVKKWLSDKNDTQVIYITGYPLRFCTEVYQTEHIYFVTKPLHQEELFAALDRAAANLSQRKTRTIAIRSNGQIILLSTTHIYYVESDRRLARLYTAHGIVETYISLMQLLPQLGSDFLQCHKSFLVNMAQIERIESNWLTIKSGQKVPISQAYRKKARDTYMDYLSRQL